jgi:hypothetical protein
MPPKTDSSEREIEIVFPHILHGGDEVTGKANVSDSEVGGIMDGQPKDNKEYLQKFVTPTLLKGLSQMYETRPESPIKWLADWLTENNPKDHVV